GGAVERHRRAGVIVGEAVDGVAGDGDAVVEDVDLRGVGHHRRHLEGAGNQPAGDGVEGGLEVGLRVGLVVLGGAGAVGVAGDGPGVEQAGVGGGAGADADDVGLHVDVVERLDLAFHVGVGAVGEPVGGEHDTSSRVASLTAPEARTA